MEGDYFHMDHKKRGICYCADCNEEVRKKQVAVRDATRRQVQREVEEHEKVLALARKSSRRPADCLPAWDRGFYGPLQEETVEELNFG